MRKILILILFLLPFNMVFANGFVDTDNDGVPDKDEIEIYKTNPDNPDTDDDGYSDFIELNSGFSPLNPIRIKLEDSDFDEDGLSDKMELNFQSDLSNPDTDEDGYKDGDEVSNGYDPTKAGSIKMEKKIEIDTSSVQKLYYFYNNVRMGEYRISSGKSGMNTPKGEFKIDYKHPKAWSSKYGLWMPYWMSFKSGTYGIHELPEWPGGYKEGENHLGVPVSHGCVRLGVGPAEFMYNWTDMGTKVYIY